MNEPLRLCLFDGAERKDPAFADPFRELADVEIIAQVSAWEGLRDTLKQGLVEAVAINLDDPDGQSISMVERLVQIAPQVGVVGVSSETKPQWIIGAMRAGCTQFVAWPIDKKDLQQALERLRGTRRAAPAGSKRVCVIGSSGGVGATTVACNLAMEFAPLTNRPVAIVDLNLEFGDVACSFDCTPRYSIADVCSDGIEPDHMMLEKALHNLPNGVSVLSRPDEIDHAHQVSPEGVQKMLRVLGETHPWIVVDLPRYSSFLSAAALTEADAIIIVTQLSVPCVRNASRIYQALRTMNTVEERIQIVLNRCKANFERITPDEVEAHFSKPVFAMIPNDYRRVQSSLDLGNPVMADAPNSPARLAIHEMARKLAGEQLAAVPVAAGAGGGIFGKFWKKK
jgi:pilus assembly protein CpaE